MNFTLVFVDLTLALGCCRTVISNWRKMSDNLFNHFLPIWSLSAIYIMVKNKVKTILLYFILFNR